MRHSALTAILLGGFVAGTIDIGSACIINSLSPMVILHAIASGVLGKASFTGGWHTAAIGLLLQWGMSLIIAAIFVLAATRIPLLTRYWIASGLAYGVAIYFVMNDVVVPLSNAPFKSHFVLEKAAEDMFAMLLFGLIVAFFAKRSSPV